MFSVAAHEFLYLRVQRPSLEDVSNAPQSPAARNILRLIERLASIRALGLDRARADMIPASVACRDMVGRVWLVPLA